MSHTITAEREIQEIGGEPLDGSGFESETPELDFSSINSGTEDASQ
jgi:hypothetical protein